MSDDAFPVGDFPTELTDDDIFQPPGADVGDGVYDAPPVDSTPMTLDELGPAPVADGVTGDPIPEMGSDLDPDDRSMIGGGLDTATAGAAAPMPAISIDDQLGDPPTDSSPISLDDLTVPVADPNAGGVQSPVPEMGGGGIVLEADGDTAHDPVPEMGGNGGIVLDANAALDDLDPTAVDPTVVGDDLDPTAVDPTAVGDDLDPTATGDDVVDPAAGGDDLDPTAVGGVDGANDDAGAVIGGPGDVLAPASGAELSPAANAALDQARVVVNVFVPPAAPAVHPVVGAVANYAQAPRVVEQLVPVPIPVPAEAPADHTDLSVMRSMLDALGAETTIIDGASLDQLREAIADGRGVLIAVDPDEIDGKADDSFLDAGATSLFVITGIDEDAGVAFGFEPPDGDLITIELDALTEAWDDSGNQMLLSDTLEAEPADKSAPGAEHQNVARNVGLALLPVTLAGAAIGAKRIARMRRS